MALQLISRPQDKYVAGYNPIVFVINSNNKNLEGFKYVFNIYSAGTSTQLASTQLVSPSYGTGYGVISLEKIIQNYLTFNFSGSSQIPDSWVAFDVKVGESYGTDWEFTDYQFYNATGTTYHAYTELININTGVTHGYVVGDQINITQDPLTVPIDNLSMNGLHTVVLSSSTTSVVIDYPYTFSNLGFEVSGVTVSANNSRAIFPDLVNYSGYVATNSAVPFVLKKINNSEYVMSGTSGDKLFLTDCPNPTQKTRNEKMWFNIINNYSTNAYYLYAQNSDGDLFRKFIADTMDPLMQQETGPANIGDGMIAVSGTGPVVKSSTTWYDVWVTNVGTGQVSEKFRINIDNRCVINDYSIEFLDRMGSFGSFAFQLKQQDKSNIVRKEYNKSFGTAVIGGEWTYNTTDAGMSIYNVDLTRIITLNTNWMSEADAQYFTQLVSSPVTYLNYEGYKIRVNVKDGEYETSFHRNKTLIRKTITVAISNNDTINI